MPVADLDRQVFPERLAGRRRRFRGEVLQLLQPQPPPLRIGLHTAASVQFGTAPEVRALRQQTLNAAHAAHPERFGNRRPQPPKLPPVAWINQPSQQAFIQTA